MSNLLFFLHRFGFMLTSHILIEPFCWCIWYSESYQHTYKDRLLIRSALYSICISVVQVGCRNILCNIHPFLLYLFPYNYFPFLFSKLLCFFTLVCIYVNTFSPVPWHAVCEPEVPDAFDVDYVIESKFKSFFKISAQCHDSLHGLFSWCCCPWLAVCCYSYVGDYPFCFICFICKNKIRIKKNKYK